MPKLAVKMPRNIVPEISPIADNAKNELPLELPQAFGGLAGGLVLGSCVNVAGAGVGRIVSSQTGISHKITCLLGCAGAGAYLVNYLGNSPLSIGLKIGVSTSSVFWSMTYGAIHHRQNILDDRNLDLEGKALLCGLVVTAGGACLGYPALATLFGGICSNLLIKIGSLYDDVGLHQA